MLNTVKQDTTELGQGLPEVCPPTEWCMTDFDVEPNDKGFQL